MEIAPRRKGTFGYQFRYEKKYAGLFNALMSRCRRRPGNQAREVKGREGGAPTDRPRKWRRRRERRRDSRQIIVVIKLDTTFVSRRSVSAKSSCHVSRRVYQSAAHRRCCSRCLQIIPRMDTTRKFHSLEIVLPKYNFNAKIVCQSKY